VRSHEKVTSFEPDLLAVDDFLRRWRGVPPKQRHRLVADLPFDAMRVAAIRHPDPWTRRACLGLLDHHANDASTETFLGALADPVPPVRETALHAIACERCRKTELCVSDVVPVLAGVLRSDPSPDVRHKTISILLRLAGRDSRVRGAIAMATADPDPIVRETALAAAAGRYAAALVPNRHDQLRRRRTRKGKVQGM
jgi:hypothetical protein